QASHHDPWCVLRRAPRRLCRLCRLGRGGDRRRLRQRHRRPSREVVVHLGDHHRAELRDGGLSLGGRATGRRRPERARHRLQGTYRQALRPPRQSRSVVCHGADARAGLDPDAARSPAAGSGHRAHRKMDRRRRPERVTAQTNMRRLLLPALAFLLVSVVFGGAAQAYPQFQFSSGTNRCSQCHYSPAGGGLITSWGRDESGDTISLGGDGAFLHGLWSPPSWLALGADVRLATIRNDVGGPESPEVAYFPMQGDFYGRVAFSDAFSLNVTLGIR